MFLSNLLDLFSHIFYLMLHVTGTGSFPRALSAPQEKKCLEEMAQGFRNRKITQDLCRRCGYRTRFA